jgi:UDP-N-acetylglucosamine acyltransferase
MNMKTYDDRWYDYKNNKIHTTAEVNWDRVEIGSGNEIGPYVCIGTDAQHTREESSGNIQIGNDNVFREYTTVHLPTRFSMRTVIGSNCYFMVLSHIAHDCVVEDNVIFSNNVTMGGHSWVMTGSQLGFGVLIHQYLVVGSYSMIGMGAVLTRKCVVIPGHVWAGNPATKLGMNNVGIERKVMIGGISERDAHHILETETTRYKSVVAEIRGQYI